MNGRVAAARSELRRMTINTVVVGVLLAVTATATVFLWVQGAAVLWPAIATGINISLLIAGLDARAVAARALALTGLLAAAEDALEHGEDGPLAGRGVIHAVFAGGPLDGAEIDLPPGMPTEHLARIDLHTPAGPYRAVSVHHTAISFEPADQHQEDRTDG